jgi:hypothetical protein
VKQEQIDCGRYAAAAIHDDLAVLADSGIGKLRCGVSSVVNVLLCGSIRLAAGTLTLPGIRPTIAARLQALMELRAERIDDHNVRISGCGEYRLLINEPTRLWFGDEDRRRIALGWAALDRTALKLPFIKPPSSTAASSKPGAPSASTRDISSPAARNIAQWRQNRSLADGRFSDTRRTWQNPKLQQLWGLA